MNSPDYRGRFFDSFSSGKSSRTIVAAESVWNPAMRAGSDSGAATKPAATQASRSLQAFVFSQSFSRLMFHNRKLPAGICRD
jgi:hypothetical protein